MLILIAESGNENSHACRYRFNRLGAGTASSQMETEPVAGDSSASLPLNATVNIRQ